MRDGHEPNEAEEQRPCCVPIEPVHVISSPKDRREQEGYQISGSFGEKSWGDFAAINPVSFAREAIVAKHGHTLPYRMAMTAGLAFCQHHRRAFSILRHPSRSRKHRGTRSGNGSTGAKDLGHHATSLRSSTRQGLGAWTASTLFRTALFTANTGARGTLSRHRLLYHFSVQREIETVALRILRHAEADNHLDREEDDQTGDGIINEDDGDPDALIEELTSISFQNTRRSAVLLDCEYPGQQRPDDAANRMHAETIQRIVIAEHALQAGASPVAEDARANSDCKGTDGSNETGSRCNGNKAGDRTRADADDGWLAPQRPFHQHPGEGGDGRGNLGHQHCHSSLHACRDSRASVETEPADPKERGADEGEHHVVRRPRRAALAEHDGAHKPRHPGVDVHDGTAGEIQHFHPCGVVAGSQEPVRSPDPVRNWRIDENRPQADEPKHGRELHALGKRASNECRRDNSKRHLKADVHAFGDGRGQWIGIADTSLADVAQDVPE